MKLIDDLANVLERPFSNPKDWKRLRLCVTPEEYVELRKYLLLKYGEFYGKIRGVPLQIEVDYELPHREVTVQKI